MSTPLTICLPCQAKGFNRINRFSDLGDEDQPPVVYCQPKAVAIVDLLPQRVGELDPLLTASEL